MNKLVFATIMLFALLFAGCIGVNPPGGNGPVACTMEAKICPDGSAVGRVGPNCEFAPCPGTSSGGSTECGECPMYAPPHPDFCKEGTIVAGQVNECGCRAPPSCACTEEAKVCPDGSAVGRTGPNCAFAACPSGGNTDKDFLLSHEWRLMKIDNEVLTDSPVHIQFEGSSFNGNAGCNNMGGSYTLNGDQINFGQTAITLMYCEETADLEGKVLAKIGGGPYRWEIADQALNFYKGEELVMIWGVDTG